MQLYNLRYAEMHLNVLVFKEQLLIKDNVSYLTYTILIPNYSL
jgi:hypothetical protein